MPLFTTSDVMVVPTHQPDLVRRWYEENLGVRLIRIDEAERATILGYSEEDCGLWLVEPKPGEGPTRAEGAATGSLPIFFSDNVEKAHRLLVSRGVDAGPIQSDPGGMCFFEFRDLEGNLLEVCEER
ncbi:MAG: VOC family protein [Candidatus Acidiferrales bacterium]